MRGIELGAENWGGNWKRENGDRSAMIDLDMWVGLIKQGSF